MISNIPPIRIFISYAHEDLDYALKLYSMFKQTPNIIPWLDKKDLLPGMDWEKEIASAIGQSQFVILMLSNKLINKQGYVQKEVRIVLDRLSEYPPGTIFLIPARIDSSQPIHTELKRLQWVDLFDNWDNGAAEILNAIEHQQHRAVSPAIQRAASRDIAGIWHDPKSTVEFAISFPLNKILISAIDRKDDEKLIVQNVQWDGQVLSLETIYKPTHWTVYHELTLSEDGRTFHGLYGKDAAGMGEEIWQRF